MSCSDTLIIEFKLPREQSLLLQSLLQGEDGLATIRALDPEKIRQQFWTTPSQREELISWVSSLPDSLAVEITGEWLWSEEKKC